MNALSVAAHPRYIDLRAASTSKVASAGRNMTAPTCSTATKYSNRHDHEHPQTAGACLPAYDGSPTGAGGCSRADPVRHLRRHRVRGPHSPATAPHRTTTDSAACPAGPAAHAGGPGSCSPQPWSPACWARSPLWPASPARRAGPPANRHRRDSCRGPGHYRHRPHAVRHGHQLAHRRRHTRAPRWSPPACSTWSATRPSPLRPSPASASP